MRWALFVAVSLQAGGASVLAQTSDVSSGPARQRRLSLSEAVRLAIEQSPSLASRAIDVRIADARVVEETGLDDFLLSASAAWLTDASRPISGGVTQNPLDSFHLRTAVLRPLPTGGHIGLRLESDYTRYRSTPLSAEGPSQWSTPALSLEVRHPLLRGAGIRVARAGQRRARAQRDLAIQEREAVVAGVLRQVSEAYWELSFATEEVQIRRESLALAQQQLRVVEANIGVGKQAPSASAEVEVAIALRQAEALASQHRQRQRSSLLRRVLGLSIGEGEPTLVAIDSPIVVEAESSVHRALVRTMARNPELLAVRQQGRLATVDVEVAENDLLPQLDVAASGGPSGNADAIDVAFARLARFEGYQVQASLLFSHPIGRRAARGRVAASREARQQFRLTERDLRDQIRVQVVTAVDLVRTTRKQVEILERATRLAELDLEAERARFSAGRSSNFDVLRRQDGLAMAQFREARTRVDHVRAAAGLDALTGEILDRHGARVR